MYHSLSSVFHLALKNNNSLSLSFLEHGSQLSQDQNIGTFLDNQAIMVWCVHLRLGWELVDCFVRHGLSRQSSAGRHIQINKMVQRSSVSTKLISWLEPNGIVGVHGKRPALSGIFQPIHKKCGEHCSHSLLVQQILLSIQQGNSASGCELHYIKYIFPSHTFNEVFNPWTSNVVK